MVELKGGDIAVLFVSDLERARRFYADQLGLTEQHHDDNSYMFEADEIGILLLVGHAADDLLGAAQVDHGDRLVARSLIVFAVEDCDAAYRELSDRGVEFIRPPEDRWWGFRTAHFRDPDGHVFEIHSDVRPS